MSDDRVNWKSELAVLTIRIVLGVIAAAILVPLLVVVFRRLRGQAGNRNSEVEGGSPNTTTAYTYRGKHSHQDHTSDGEAAATP